MRRAILAALMALIILLMNAIATMTVPAQEKSLIKKRPLRLIVIADKTTTGLSNAGR